MTVQRFSWNQAGGMRHDAEGAYVTAYDYHRIADQLALIQNQLSLLQKLYKNLLKQAKADQQSKQLYRHRLSDQP